MGQYGCGLPVVGPAGSPMRHNGGPAPSPLRAEHLGAPLTRWIDTAQDGTTLGVAPSQCAIQVAKG